MVATLFGDVEIDESPPIRVQARLPVVTDTMGVSVPTRLRALFAGAKQRRAALQRIRREVEKLVRIKYADDGSDALPELLDPCLREAASDILLAVERLDQTAPAIVCPVCDGEPPKAGCSCRPCVNGVIYVPGMDRLTGEQERKARQKAGL